MGQANKVALPPRRCETPRSSCLVGSHERHSDPNSKHAGDSTGRPPRSCVLLQYIAALLLSSTSAHSAVGVNRLLPRKEEGRKVGRSVGPSRTCTTGSRDGVSKRYVTFDSGKRGDGGKRPPSASAAPSCPTPHTSTASVLLSLITMPPSSKNVNDWERLGGGGGGRIKPLHKMLLTGPHASFPATGMHIPERAAGVGRLGGWASDALNTRARSFGTERKSRRKPQRGKS